MVTDPVERRFKKQLNAAAKKGEEWVQQLLPQLQTLPQGSWVCIDLQTGEYVVGATDDQAIARFREKNGDRPSWLHGIGVSIRA